MRPIVPKIRVGDVLLGTKNLRNWLQTASLLGYVRGLAGQPPYQSDLYIPAKSDRFVVAVNAWETFGVWGLDQDVVILFCNPSHKQPDYESAMTPALFAQWFIHTRGRHPDLLSWPDHAYHLWGSLQMNAISAPAKRLGYAIREAREHAFSYQQHNGAPREVVKERILGTIRHGLTRQRAKRVRVAGDRRIGPTLVDIQMMRKEICGFSINPRVVKRFKEEISKIKVEVPKSVFEMSINNQ